MKPGEPNWTKIGAIAAVLIIPITIVGIGLPLLQTAMGEHAPQDSGTGRTVVSGSSANPGYPQEPATTTLTSPCISPDGRATSCASADALFVTAATTCDPSGVTTALGMDPAVVELLIEAREVGGQCGAAPTARAQKAGATASDLVAVRDGQQRAGLMACLVDESDAGSVVPCSEPHQAEPVTDWRPATDLSAIREECRSAAASFVAGRVDVHGQPLSSGWLMAQSDQEPVYRCLVKGPAPLRGTVHQLSGRPLPTGP